MKNLYRYASLLAAAVMLLSCSGQVDPDQGQTGNNQALKITSDRNILQANVDVASITVTLGDEVITSDVVFFNGDDEVIELDDFKFVAPCAGDHVLWASYGTYISDEISIRAIDIPIPETPADPNPSSTAFKARVLMTEFTTTGCGYCPNMKLLIHGAMEDAAVADKVVLTACHSDLVNSKADPAYVKTEFDTFCGSPGFPCVDFDMYSMFNNYTVSVSEFKKMVNEFHSAKENMAAGIAVTSSFSRDDNKIVAKATVKAAVPGPYRVGAFLLEDGIYGSQSGGSAQSWMNIHDGVIRYFDCTYFSRSGKEQFYGYSVGDIEAGGTADYVFDWDLDEIWEKGALNGEMYGNYYWDPFVMDNLHLVVFTTTLAETDNGDQFYYVNNVVDCPINGDTPYEYR